MPEEANLAKASKELGVAEVVGVVQDHWAHLVKKTIMFMVRKFAHQNVRDDSLRKREWWGCPSRDNQVRDHPKNEAKADKDDAVGNKLSPSFHPLVVSQEHPLDKILFQSIHSIAYHQGDDDEEEGEGDHGLVGEEGLRGVEGEEKGGARPQFLMLVLIFKVGTGWVGVDLNKVMFWHLYATKAEGRLQWGFVLSSFPIFVLSSFPIFVSTLLTVFLSKHH